MLTDDCIRLVGNTGSPYTQKMVALLRYRRVPYAITWGEPGAVCDALGVQRPRPVFMPTFFFPGDGGEMQAVCDSTPIIRRLEEMYPERSVLPGDPALAFIDYLIEDFADEWCTKYMFHYRWYPAQDADNAGTLLPLGLDVSMPAEQLQEAKHWFSQRQIGRLYVVGSNDTTAPVIDASYRRFLAAMESHLASQKFTLGGRPGAGDFGLQSRGDHHLGKFRGPPHGVDDDRESRAGADRHHLAGRREHPGQVGDRWRHRLCREERQLAHWLDTRPVGPAHRAAKPVRPRENRWGENEAPPRCPWARGGARWIVVGQTARTPVACGPLGLCPTSNSTLWFSSKVRNPDPWISV